MPHDPRTIHVNERMNSRTWALGEDDVPRMVELILWLMIKLKVMPEQSLAGVDYLPVGGFGSALFASFARRRCRLPRRDTPGASQAGTFLSYAAL